VTGGTGFIGSNLALRLLQDGHEVFITGRTGEQAMPEFAGKIINPECIDWKSLGVLDAVFHQAAITDTTVLDREQMLKANVEFSRLVLENAVQNGCRQIVYASSTAVYGNSPVPYRENMTPLNPLQPYAESKKLLEEFANEFGKEHPDVTMVGLRYCNVYGPREAHKGKMANLIYQLAQQMQKENPRLFKWGEQKRDNIYVKDVVSANILASKAKQSCIVNCGSGKATTFNEIVDILNETLGLKRAIEYIDNPHTGRYQAHTECDISLAKQKIGFKPAFTIRTGIKDYYKSGFLLKN
jgi:ADP-L-glycero-D-manno-heptose 6-epimerase